MQHYSLAKFTNITPDQQECSIHIFYRDFSTATGSQHNVLLGPATIAKFTHMYSQHLRALW